MLLGGGRGLTGKNACGGGADKLNLSDPFREQQLLT